MNNKDIEFTLDDTKINEIIKELCIKIEKYYILPKRAKEISNSILNKLEQGSYKGIKDPTTFEVKISKDLVEISNDLHFYFEYDPSMAQELLQKPDEEGESGYDDDYSEFIRDLKNEQYRNFHIIKAERLPGNIGYIKINDFAPAEFAGDTMIGALQFLSNSYALIFDVRNNGGGYPSMVALIVSYLWEPNSKLINTVYDSKKNKYLQSWTLPYVPGKRFSNKPVYVLTSRRSASAAEELAYDLKMMERATIVGETTRGAANPVDIFPLSDEFVIWLPIGRSINPISKDNWEGKGVSPHYNVSQEKALEKAHSLALTELLESESDEKIKSMLKFESDYCKAKYNPIQLDLKALQDYTGQYERYEILIKENQVYYERANLKHKLITNDNKIFFPNEEVKLSFEEENGEKILIVERRDFSTKLRLQKTKN